MFMNDVYVYECVCLYTLMCMFINVMCHECDVSSMFMSSMCGPPATRGSSSDARVAISDLWSFSDAISDLWSSSDARGLYQTYVCCVPKCVMCLCVLRVICMVQLDVTQPMHYVSDVYGSARCLSDMYGSA